MLIDASVQPQADLLVLSNAFRAGPVDPARRYDGRAGAFIGVFGAGSCNPQDMVYGPDHKLYILDQPTSSYPFGGCTNNRMVGRFNGQTGLQDLDDPFSTFVPLGGFDFGAYGMAFGPDGNLYITDFRLNSVRRYQGPFGAAPGQFIDNFVTSESGGLYNPTRLVFGPDQNLYVVSVNRKVLRFQGPLSGNPGAPIDTFVESGAGGVQSISDLAFGRDKLLYVASQAGVMRFNGAASNGPSQFVDRFASGATSLAFGADGDLFINASTSVLRFDGSTGLAKGSFASTPLQTTRILFSAIPNHAGNLGDFNRDGCVDQADLALLTADLMGPGPHNAALFDLTGDGRVTVTDSRKLALLFTRPQGASCR